MKLTKEQLVDMLCTATYGCDWLECTALKRESYLDEKYDKQYLENRSREEKWADRLLNGGKLVCLDFEDSDDCYNPRRYELVLEDFEIRLEEASKSNDECIARSYLNWKLKQSDYYDCNNLLQYVMFGEVVYG